MLPMNLGAENKPLCLVPSFGPASEARQPSVSDAHPVNVQPLVTAEFLKHLGDFLRQRETETWGAGTRSGRHGTSVQDSSATSNHPITVQKTGCQMA